jgi:hypothetical protein
LNPTGRSLDRIHAEKKSIAPVYGIGDISAQSMDII